MLLLRLSSEGLWFPDPLLLGDLQCRRGRFHWPWPQILPALRQYSLPKPPFRCHLSVAPSPLHRLLTLRLVYGIHGPQVYKDRKVVEQLVRRAEKAGFKAIALTVDTPRLGRREADIRNRWGKERLGAGLVPVCEL